MNKYDEAILELSEWVKQNTKKGQHPPQYGLDKALILCRDGIRKGLEDLVIFTYHQTASFRKATEWKPIEMVSRGIIFEKETGKLIARPFYKFYNYGELPSDSNISLNDPHELLYKHDGSLGICFWYNDNWWVTTYGSLNSEQGIRATSKLRQKDTSKLNKKVTIKAEIIYPENRIVTNYEGYDDLIYLDQQPIDSNSNDVSDVSIFTPYPDKLNVYYNYINSNGLNHSIESLLHFCKNQSDYNYEGFVLKIQGRRIKFKTDSYLSVHRAKFDISIKRIKELMMQNPAMLMEYKETLPNEFFGEIDNMISELNKFVMEKMSMVDFYVNNIVSKHGLDIENIPKDIGRLIHPDVAIAPSELHSFIWMKLKNIDYTKIYNAILKSHGDT